MLIILAIVLAVAVFLAIQLTGMTEKFGEKVNQTGKVIDCQTAHLIEGSYCYGPEDCGNGNPDTWDCDPVERECILVGPCSE